jgi:hypothetical protein
LVDPTTWALIARALPTKAVHTRDLTSSKVLMKCLVSTKDSGIIASVEEEVLRQPLVAHFCFCKRKKKSILVR